MIQAVEPHLESMIYETQTLGLATHVHVQDRTMNPHWVELVVFLLGAGENSYFSVSTEECCYDVWKCDSINNDVIVSLIY